MSGGNPRRRLSRSRSRSSRDLDLDLDRDLVLVLERLLLDRDRDLDFDLRLLRLGDGDLLLRLLRLGDFTGESVRIKSIISIGVSLDCAVLPSFASQEVSSTLPLIDIAPLPTLGIPPGTLET